jgi:hypothetical protein
VADAHLLFDYLLDLEHLVGKGLGELNPQLFAFDGFERRNFEEAMGLVDVGGGDFVLQPHFGQGLS